MGYTIGATRGTGTSHLPGTLPYFKWAHVAQSLVCFYFFLTRMFEDILFDVLTVGTCGINLPHFFIFNKISLLQNVFHLFSLI
jgi:hypothetical protein